MTTSAAFAQRPTKKEDEPLADKEFQENLDQIAELLDGGGWLLIFRNQVPKALLGAKALHLRGVKTHYGDTSIRDDWRSLRRRAAVIESHADRVTLVLPRKEYEWFIHDPALLSGNIEAAGAPIPNKKTLISIRDEFYASWKDSDALWEFDPERKPPPHRLLESVRAKLGYPEWDELPVTNFLPNLWLGLTNETGIEIVGHRSNMVREMVEVALVDWITRLYVEEEPTKEVLGPRLRDEKLVLVKVSSGQFNPGHMGQRIWSDRTAARLLAHAAIALIYSWRTRDGVEAPWVASVGGKQGTPSGSQSIPQHYRKKGKPKGST